MRFVFYWEQLIKREERNGKNLGEAVLSLTLILAQKVTDIWVPLKLVAPYNLMSSWAAIQTLWCCWLPGSASCGCQVCELARLTMSNHVHAPQQSSSISVVDRPSDGTLRSCSFCPHQKPSQVY